MLTWLAKGIFLHKCHPSVVELSTQFELTGFPPQWSLREQEDQPAWYMGLYLTYWGAKQKHEAKLLKGGASSVGTEAVARR